MEISLTWCSGSLPGSIWLLFVSSYLEENCEAQPTLHWDKSTPRTTLHWDISTLDQLCTKAGKFDQVTWALSSLQQAPLLAVFVTEDFTEHLCKALPGNTVAPRTLGCTSALEPSKTRWREAVWFSPLTPQTQKKRDPPCFSTVLWLVCSA